MLRLLGRIRAKEVAGRIRMLQEETTTLTIYENGLPVETDIGALAKEALQLIDEKGEERK